MFISTRVRAQPLATEILIPEEHQEFARTELKRTSILRLDKIATVSKTLIFGEIGEIGESLRKDINPRLREIFQL